MISWQICGETLLQESPANSCRWTEISWQTCVETSLWEFPANPCRLGPGCRHLSITVHHPCIDACCSHDDGGPRFPCIFVYRRRYQFQYEVSCRFSLLLPCLPPHHHPFPRDRTALSVHTALTKVEVVSGQRMTAWTYDVGGRDGRTQGVPMLDRNFHRDLCRILSTKVSCKLL